MKKGIVLVGACLLLGACQTVGTSNPTTQVTQQKLTLKDVQEKQKEAVKSMKSLAFDMDMKFNLLGEEKPRTVMDMSMSGEITMEPIAMKMQMKTQGQGIEMYYVGDNYYVKVGDNWQKTKTDIETQIDSMEKQFQSVTELDAQYSTMEETNSQYVIRLEMNDKSQIENYMRKSADSLGNQEMFNNLIQQGAVIDKLAMIYRVDKKTFYLDSLTGNIEMSVSQAGQAGQISLDMNVTYKNINGVKEIELPAEAQKAN